MSTCADLVEKFGTDTRAICGNYGLCSTHKARTTTEVSGRSTTDAGRGSKRKETNVLRRTVVWIVIEGDDGL